MSVCLSVQSLIPVAWSDGSPSSVVLLAKFNPTETGLDFSSERDKVIRVTGAAWHGLLNPAGLEDILFELSHLIIGRAKFGI